VPAVSERTIRKTWGASKSGMIGVPALGANDLKRKT
jgi:hypothetical protein